MHQLRSKSQYIHLTLTMYTLTVVVLLFPQVEWNGEDRARKLVDHSGFSCSGALDNGYHISITAISRPMLVHVQYDVM